MSAGHHNVETHAQGSPEYEQHTEFLHKLLDDPEFSAAVKAYTKEDDRYDIPFLGGSNNAGDTVYFDRHFVQDVEAGRVKYEGKSYDPRKYIKLHEAIEGAALRLLHAKYDKDNADGLPGGHLIATWAERRAVEHDGLDFDKYQASLEPFIKADEHEKVTNPPPDLIRLPYKGTVQAREIEGGYVPAAGVAPGALASDQNRPLQWGLQDVIDQRAQTMQEPGPFSQDLKRQKEELENNYLTDVPWIQRYRNWRESPGGYTPAKGDNMAKYEGSRADLAEDKREAAKRGMSMPQWERSAADRRMDRSPGGYVPNPEQSVAAKQAAATHPRMHALAIGAANLLHPMGHITGGQKARITAKSRNALRVAKKAKAGPPAAPMFGSLAPAMPEPGMGGAGPGMGSPIV